MTGKASQAGKVREDWLKWEVFDLSAETPPTHEAVLREDETGFFHADCTTVTTGNLLSLEFNTYEGARAWLEEQGYADYTGCAAPPYRHTVAEREAFLIEHEREEPWCEHSSCCDCPWQAMGEHW